MEIVTKKDLVQDNIRVFGHADAAAIARRQRIPFTHFYWMAFGRTPRHLAAAPTETAEKLREVLRNSARTHVGALAKAR